MGYILRYHSKVEKTISKLKKRDPPLAEQLKKKILEIYQNPKHYKPLKWPEAGTRRAHVGSFVLKYRVIGEVIKILSFEHHD